MKVLVIPDVHLKPWMFERASELMKKGTADRAVCLMDIPDDWNQTYNLELYIQTYDAAIAFSTEYPDTLWCYGNHDVSYLWSRGESGYSPIASGIVCEKLRNLKESLPDLSQLAFVHRIDNLLFLHGGLTEDFVRRFVPDELYDDVDAVVSTINVLGPEELWLDQSPLWYRPQYGLRKTYNPGNLLQVVGHTPTEDIIRLENIISCDVFSTYIDGDPIGTQEFLLIDTVSGEY